MARSPLLVGAVADGVETASPIQYRRHLGQDPSPVADRADAAGDIEWMVSVDCTINRAHQHTTNASPVEQPTGDSRRLVSHPITRSAAPGEACRPKMLRGLRALLAELAVRRLGPGRACTRP